LDKLYSLAKELRDNKRLFRYYKRINKEQESEARFKGDDFDRNTIKKRRCCCLGSIKYDAEDYYREKVIKISLQVKDENKKRLKTNGGFGFVTF
jgi:hypothetical protein